LPNCGSHLASAASISSIICRASGRESTYGSAIGQVAKALRVDRETVARYVHLAEAESNPAEVTAKDETAGVPNPATNLSTRRRAAAVCPSGLGTSAR
jgi:hypothetical protein